MPSVNLWSVLLLVIFDVQCDILQIYICYRQTAGSKDSSGWFLSCSVLLSVLSSLCNTEWQLQCSHLPNKSWKPAIKPLIKVSNLASVWWICFELYYCSHKLFPEYFPSFHLPADPAVYGSVLIRIDEPWMLPQFRPAALVVWLRVHYTGTDNDCQSA